MIIVLLFSMLFCHIIGDYLLQNCLARMKQKKWWSDTYFKGDLNELEKSMYKNDYKAALMEHAFEWAFMVLLPTVIDSYIKGIISNEPFMIFYLVQFGINWLIHAFVDDLKANKMKINLVEDQLFHVLQVLIVWISYVAYVM